MTYLYTPEIESQNSMSNDVADLGELGKVLALFPDGQTAVSSMNEPKAIRQDDVDALVGLGWSDE